MSELSTLGSAAEWVPSDPGPVPGEQQVFGRAVQVIGDRQQAMRWLGTPVRALGYATPISLLHDLEGRDAVMALLGRLEHGVL